jgi:hypothetical protein
MIVHYLLLFGCVFLAAWGINIMTGAKHEKSFSPQIASILDIIGTALFLVGMLLFKFL